MNITLSVKDGTRLPLKEDEILLYDPNTRLYYSTTQETFLKPQNVKIENLTRELSRVERLYTEKVKELKDENNKTKKELIDKYNDFLIQYKETNEKIINMIQDLVKGGQ